MRSTVGRILLPLGILGFLAGCATLVTSADERYQGKSRPEYLAGKAPAGVPADLMARDLTRAFHWKTATVSVIPLTEPLQDAEAREALAPRKTATEAPGKAPASVKPAEPKAVVVKPAESPKGAPLAKLPAIPRASCFRFDVKSSDSADTTWFQSSYILVTDWKGKCQKVAFVSNTQGCVPLKVDFSHPFKMELDPKYQKELSKQTLAWD